MRNENKYLVEMIKSTLLEQDYFFVISYKSLKSSQQNELKFLLRESNAVLQVQKNSLLRKSAENTEFTDIRKFALSEASALIFGKGEASETAKKIKKFSKNHKQIKFKFSYVEGEVLNSEESLEIANLPSKESSQVQLVSLLNSIPQKFVSLLNAVPAGIVNILNARKNSME